MTISSKKINRYFLMFETLCNFNIAGRYEIAYIDPSDWKLCPFIDGPFFRPIDIRFNPIDQSLYIVDFGKFEMHDSLGVVAQQNTGRVLRVTASKP